MIKIKMFDFGWVKRTDKNYIVLANKSKQNSGYGVPFVDNSSCKYKAAEVEEYLKLHPEMEFFKYDDDPTDEEIEKEKTLDNLNAELAELEDWFNNKYDIQVAQYQRCERLKIEYKGELSIDELDAKAVQTATRITSLRQQIKELS